jgi:hypothetical protein
MIKRRHDCQVGLAFWLAGVALLFLPAALSAQDHKDPKAVAIAQTMMQAMGGESAWQAAHFVRFNFKVTVGGKVVEDNHHLWDRKEGRYRIDRMPRDGKEQVILFKIGDYQRDKSGAAYVNGQKLEGATAQKAVDDGYASYINDTWWLAMPWKWMNTGVNLKYLGVKPWEGQPCDVVELTFNHVGLTPGDMYHAFVSQKSHLMIHWEYKLQSGERDAWDWQYTETHGIKLASNHTNAKKVSIDMEPVSVLDTVDESTFTNPTQMLADLK